MNKRTNKPANQPVYQNKINLKFALRIGALQREIRQCTELGQIINTLENKTKKRTRENIGRQ